MPTGGNGVPVVAGALATLECRLVAAHRTGDHTIYVGEVTSLSSRPGRPLLYFGSAYQRLGADERPAE
jgi:flavin reductase (DIM6/NTAB) family NADH-FMN oxidoreductase RutF